MSNKKIFLIFYNQLLLIFGMLCLGINVIHCSAETTRKILPYKSAMINYSKPIKFSIYLPESDDQTDKYPVLYLLHGQSQDEKIWDQMGIKEIADHLISTGCISPLVIVMPREEAYMEKISESDFGNRIINELIPYVESNFPVLTDPASRAIGGISRGALWAQKIAFNHYGTFGLLGQHSLPAAVFSDYVIYRIYADSEGKIPLMKIRIDSGTEDPYLKGALAFSKQLADVKAPYMLVIEPGGHDPEYWKEHLEDYLIWYADNLKNPADD